MGKLTLHVSHFPERRVYTAVTGDEEYIEERSNAVLDVYVARQPIFDRQMNTYGYELLYRQSHNNYYEGTDDNQATAALLDTSFLVIGFGALTGGGKGFINFPQELLKNGIPFLLPKQQVVIEILERVDATPDVVAACKKLKSEGYILALDDFILEQGGGGCAPLIDLADIIKIEFPLYPEAEQRKLIQKYKHRITFLAEKVETSEEYRRALEMGYSLFQGYFFSKPMMVNARDIGSLNVNLMRLLRELQRKEPDLGVVARIIEQDLGLSYKLLKMANSLYYGAKYPVRSIRQALLHLGTKEMIQWVNLMLLRSVNSHENAELVRASVVRGKMLASMAEALGRPAAEADYFIAGSFSSLDELLHDDMSHIVEDLPLSQEVIDALLGVNNGIRSCLDSILALERADWGRLSEILSEKHISQEAYMTMYLEALRWQQSFQLN